MATERVRVLTVVGTRPEAVKLAPIIHELALRPRIDSRVCVTAQHRDMLDQVLRLFGVTPDYDLDVMADNQTPTQVAAAILAKLEPILQLDKPDWVLVQGDTTTVAAASLAAFYARAQVGHVEAGLRTFDKWQPFPEEINRRIAGVIADLHFAPTARSRTNLRREDVPEQRILVTGNTAIDALQWVVRQPIPPAVREQFSEWGICEDLENAHDGCPRPILVTAHRRENFGDPLENICLALRDLVEAGKGTLRVVYPVHRNPNVWNPVHRLLSDIPGVVLTPPLEYLSLIQLMRRSAIVLTDSGGIQEEAPGLGKPVLVMRDVTERPEGVEAGTVALVGTDRQKIVSTARQLLDDPSAYDRMAHAINPYGDGHASSRIVSALLGEPVVQFT
jgi:UDP-N-acetylglucosamine 2-epimerase (non-hydrolysing)